MRLASGLSAHADSVRAGRAAAAKAGERLDGPADLVFLFFTAHHLPEADRLADVVRAELRPACLVGVSAESVLNGAHVLDRVPGVSILAGRLPGVSIVPFTSDDLMPYAGDEPEELARFGRVFGAAEDLRATFLFADPFSVPLGGLLPAMNHACGQLGGGGVILGGCASAGHGAEKNALILDDVVRPEGAVGVSVRGPLVVDAVVSQGCRAFGPNLVITACRRNVILKLGGRRALDVLRDCVESLPEADRPLVDKGLFIGRVVDEYRERFGRGDYLIRAVTGMDERAGAVAGAEFFRVGQTVRFHIPDAGTAESDLAMLLDAQRLRAAPVGGMLITASGRARRVFGGANHDAAAVARAFEQHPAGEQLAKAGEPVSPEREALPLAGLFSSAEVGPIGATSHVHGHTACLALFREPAADGV
jgi:small ligand-binding sensory domain FIST